MATFERAYIDRLTAARAIYTSELQPELIRRLYIEYASMIVDVYEDLASGRITSGRARALRQSILDRIEQMGVRIIALAADAMDEAIALAVEGHALGIQAASEAAGVTASANLAGVPTAAVEAMIRRRPWTGSGTFETLIRRGLSGMAGDVDRYLSSATARGISARQSAKELATLLARDDPALLQALRSVGPRGGRTLRAIREGITLPDVELRRVKRLLFDTYRVAVHETNTAYFETDRAAAAESPVIDLVRWTLSGRHAGLPTSPDVCDVVAEQDNHGYGPGLYHPENAPPLMHPFCMCSLEAVLRRPEDWDRPKQDVNAPRRISQQDARRTMARAPGNRKLTDKYVQRQTEAANERLQAAHAAYRER